MTFIPEMRQLQGLSYEVAELYGKPHWMAHYERDDSRTNRLDDGAFCLVCHQKATNSHHCPPRSKGNSFLLVTPIGQFILKPALFALCGSGTTGCHNDFHGGARYKATWKWYCDDYAEKWWNGQILAHMPAHCLDLYRYGCYEILDRRTKKTFEVLQ